MMTLAIALSISVLLVAITVIFLYQKIDVNTYVLTFSYNAGLGFGTIEVLQNCRGELSKKDIDNAKKAINKQNPVLINATKIKTIKIRNNYG